MIQCSCIVQEGQIDAGARARLEVEMGDLARKHFSEDLGLGWFDISKGDGFTAGEPSRASVVVLMAPAISQELRTEVLSEICDLWARETGCHVNDVVATVMDRPN